MHSESSRRISGPEFDALVEAALRRYRGDLFLTNSQVPGESASLIGLNPYATLLVDASTTRDEISAFAFADPHPTFGFLAYPYGLAARGVRSDKLVAPPLGCLKKYAAVWRYDNSAQLLQEFEYRKSAAPEAGDLLGGRGGVEKSDSRHEDYAPMEAVPSLTEEEYCQRVAQTIEYIRGGYIYQLNLSIRFSLLWPRLDAAALFMNLWRCYPAPFYAWMEAGPLRIISTSPERFLQVRAGEVLSQPIKGTLRSARLDRESVDRLTGSLKEQAELAMIVDLIRNDISCNCEYGSVRVDGHKSVFRVDDLLQMYSNVRGRLRRDRTCVDLLLDAFPCGSVTGCPKLKALELIDLLEPHGRDIYCGTVFVIRGPRDLESSVAIRTGYFDTDSRLFHFFAGSGIVVKSEPSAEYAETLAKAEKFLALAARLVEPDQNRTARRRGSV